MVTNFWGKNAKKDIVHLHSSHRHSTFTTLMGTLTVTISFGPDNRHYISVFSQRANQQLNRPNSSIYIWQSRVQHRPQTKIAKMARTLNTGQPYIQKRSKLSCSCSRLNAALVLAMHFSSSLSSQMLAAVQYCSTFAGLSVWLCEIWQQLKTLMQDHYLIRQT